VARIDLSARDRSNFFFTEDDTQHRSRDHRNDPTLGAISPVRKRISRPVVPNWPCKTNSAPLPDRLSPSFVFDCRGEFARDFTSLKNSYAERKGKTLSEDCFLCRESRAVPEG
jgi:hypothetical protein